MTDRFHVLRCRRVFGRHFAVADAVGVESPAWVRVRGSLREVLAIAWHGLRGRL